MAANTLKSKYNNLLRTTIALALILLVIILLSIIAFYKGWLGAPGKIYFSPDNEGYYVRCGDSAGNPSACGESGECRKVTIIDGSRELEDFICLRK